MLHWFFSKMTCKLNFPNLRPYMHYLTTQYTYSIDNANRLCTVSNYCSKYNRVDIHSIHFATVNGK